MRENFTEEIKHLTELKETLINYVWEKSHFKKSIISKFSVDSGFSNIPCSKKKNP